MDAKYGWGHTNLKHIETVQQYFCKYILKLNSGTASCIMLGELGRHLMKTQVDQRMINFWARLVTGKSIKISSILYKIIKEKHNSNSHNSQWLSHIQNTLNLTAWGWDS